MSTFGKALSNMRRSPYQALAAILIMGFTFIVGGVFFLVIYGSSLAISYFESRPQLIVFFADDTDRGNIDALANKLMQTGKVEDTKYVSKDEALSLYRDWYRDDPLLLEMVTADILPQSLEVSATEAQYLEELAQMVQADSSVEDIEYQADVVKSLVSWIAIARKVGIVLTVSLVAESFLVMLTVIGLKIAQRRDEIEIVRLLGATSWYIGKPFVLEGMLYGLIGSIVGWIVSVSALAYITPIIKTLLIGISFEPINYIFLSIFFVSLVLSGVILGSVGSFFAVLRYLR